MMTSVFQSSSSDPAAFGAALAELGRESPTVFDEYMGAPSHLGFGLGAHYCVGAPLARIEVRAALDALLKRFPGLHLDPAAALSFRYGARGFVQHGTEKLPVLLS